MGKIVGIDFGTTSSYMTYVTGMKVEFIEVQGSNRIPSLIYFPENESEKILFGREAKRQALLNPARTIVAVKKLLGKKYEEVKPFLPQLSYKVVPDAAGFPVIDLGYTTLHPQEVMALFLKHLREQACEITGEHVDNCVITIPANFNPHEIASTREAFEIAGWNVRRVIAEPTAALLAARFAQQEDPYENLLVLDIGGSSTDVSIQQTGDGVFVVKSLSGDNMLGGIDFDHALVKDLVSYFYEKEGVNYASDKVALYRLWEAAEKAKIELSSAETAYIQLPFMSVNGVVKTLEARVSREQFERACSHLVQRCLQLCEKALSSAYYKSTEIEGYFLVGAACRTPMIKEEMERFFGKKPIGSFNPEEVVAIGAGIQSGVLSGVVEGVLLLDIHPFFMYAELPEEVSKIEEIDIRNGERTVRAVPVLEGRYRLLDYGITIPTKREFDLYFNHIQTQRSCRINLFDYRNDQSVVEQAWEIEIPERLFENNAKRILKLSIDIDANGVQSAWLENELTQTTFRETRKKTATSLFGISMAELRKKLSKQDQLLLYMDQLKTHSESMPPGLYQKIFLSIEALKYVHKIKKTDFQQKFTQQVDTLFQEFAQKQMIGFDEGDNVAKSDEALKRSFLPGIVEHLTYRVDNETRLMRFIREVLTVTGDQECALFGSRLAKINGEYSMGLIERPTFITETNRIRLGLIHYLEELVLNNKIPAAPFQHILIFAETGSDAISG